MHGEGILGNSILKKWLKNNKNGDFNVNDPSAWEILANLMKNVFNYFHRRTNAKT